MKNHRFSHPVSHISSNYFHSQLPKSTEKLQGGSVGWRIQGFNDFALQSQLPWKKGTGTWQLGKLRGEMRTGGTDCSWEACSGWKEHEEIDVLKSGWKQEGARVSEGKANVRKDRMGSWRKAALETLTFCFKLKTPKWGLFSHRSDHNFLGCQAHVRHSKKAQVDPAFPSVFNVSWFSSRTVCSPLYSFSSYTSTDPNHYVADLWLHWTQIQPHNWEYNSFCSAKPTS